MSANTLIKWYKRNKRDLPWRLTSDPYKVWLSEIILQQTRVNQGMEYYLRFVNTFPTIVHLANAPEQKVMKLWQGLGYYSRARNLHATAKTVRDKFNGKFPSDYENIISLKGVGTYTAAAIASFCFGECYPVVDGNVYRVLARLYGIKTPIDTNQGKKDFYELAAEIIDKNNPGIFNQAIMEFGALQCKPQNPDCVACPLNAKCIAFEKKIVGQLPVKSKKTKQSKRYFNYLVVSDKSSLLLNKRTGNDIWQNLYDFPLIETDKKTSPEKLLVGEEFKNLFGRNKVVVKKIIQAEKHVLSHRVIFPTFIELNLEEGLNVLKKKYTIVRKDNIDKFPVPRLIEKYIKMLALRDEKSKFEE